MVFNNLTKKKTFMAIVPKIVNDSDIDGKQIVDFLSYYFSSADTAVKAVNSTAVVAVAAVPVVVSKEAKVSESEKIAKAFTIEGTYFIDMWGECVISKKGSDFKVVGGDEDFEFAEIYTTSKPNIFMVKKTGFKQTQLLELDENGNLKIDSNSGVKIYKRVN